MYEKIIKNFQQKLVNLSGSNRSLLLLRLSKEHDIDLNQVDFLNSKPAFNLIQELILGKSKISVCHYIDSRNEKVNVSGKQLQRINRKDKFLFEESGSKDLHIGWPFVQGKFSDGSAVRCPLLFFPVELVLEKNCWYIIQPNDEKVFFNKSFLLAWKHFNKSTLTEEFENFSFEAFSSDAKEFRTQLYELLKSSGMEVNFTSDLFVDKLENYKSYKSEEFSEMQQTGRLTLKSEAVLGIFPQASSYLLPDYDTLLEANSTEGLELIFNKPIPAFNSKDIKEADILTPLLLDAPQEEAIKMVKSGKSIVVQGPPGTGKSQLISNLVADFISAGKRVLVVCQKRAALDVVFERLNTLNVGSFIALVHDFKADRSKLYHQILSQIELVEEFKSENLKLDTVLLERDFKEACIKIDRVSEELNEFKTALFDDKECGYSVKELYLTSDKSLPVLQNMDCIFKYFTRDILTRYSEKLNYLLPYAVKFDSPEYYWFHRNSFRNYTVSDKHEILKQLNEVAKFNTGLKTVKDSFSLKTSEFSQAEVHTEYLNGLIKLSSNNTFYEHFQRFSSLKNESKKIPQLKKKIEVIQQKLQKQSNTMVAKSIEKDSVEKALQIIEEAQKKYSFFITRIIWNWTSKDKSYLLNLLKSNQLTFSADGLSTLGNYLQNSKTFFRIQDELNEKKEFKFINAENIDGLIEQANEIKAAILQAETWNEFYLQCKIQVEPEYLNYQKFKEKLSLFLKAVKDSSLAFTLYSHYFNAEQLNVLFEQNLLEDHIESLNIDFDSLLEYDREKDKLPFNEIQALNIILKEVKGNSLQVSDLIGNFENTIRRFWIDHIETKYPILSAVSTSKLGMLESQINESVERKRELSSQILLLKLREQVYKNEEFNRIGNRTTFRDLKHQVSKKKKIWPLRKTIESFKDELFYLMPCWLASPETVSAIFPMEDMFDIVIFDEASQCFAEKGLPAIARAKQVVITGDNKQLPPSDLYSTRFEEDTEIPETEIKSLLDLATRYLPQIMLTDHYRSKSLDLIDFSNQYFYKGKLKLIPDFHAYQRGANAIDFIKVNGLFENRQNLVEAERVVELCIEKTQVNPDKEIGVITFNVNQQNLILDLLEQRLILENKTMPVGLIVKNIENIQGDEKDIIIFSIGYAPDSAGKLNHQFGSLNLEGGENRLNVAVTRAKEKIIIVSSIHPQQLDVENAKHEGPKMLKKYLEYALNVSEGKFKAGLTANKNFRTSWFLKEQLKLQKHYNENLPFADLTENDESEAFKQLILTDDDKFFDSINIKEPFCYLPSALKNKNWNYKRIFSRNFS